MSRLAGLLLMVLFAYSNSFHNSFQFDDEHTIVKNPYIRDLRNIPKFFTDGRTFSILPRNRTYRPLVSTSLALDYAAGHSLDPLAFHLSTFFYFSVQLVLMFFLFRKLCGEWPALIATALYGLHPAMAETVNYVIQRGDLYATLGVVAGIGIYALASHKRKWGLYLIPPALGILSKPPALVFPAILFVYIWLFEREAKRSPLVRTIPSLLTTAALCTFTIAMTPKEFRPGKISAHDYWITQPLVALRFFRTFFLPDSLSADTDHRALPGIWSGDAWIGFVLLIALIAIAVYTSRNAKLRPAAFGLWWFLIAFAPAALFPVYEVENDHRMFFPFVGVVLAVTWPVALWLRQRTPGGIVPKAVPVLCACELLLLTFGTMQRNVVWHSEYSLWRDTTNKSSKNGRAWMNLALLQMGRGELQPALENLERARKLPHDHQIYINLGVAMGELNRNGEAVTYFEQALKLAPQDHQAHHYYAKYLDRWHCWPDAILHLREAVSLNPDYLDSRHLLLAIYNANNYRAQATALASDTHKRFPTELEPVRPKE